MAQPRQVPMYVFTGFLEAGKTQMIMETLRDEGFNTGERTLLIVCEQGIEEYDEKELKKLTTRVEYFDDITDFNLPHLTELDQKYLPERVMIEFNGTWNVGELLDMRLPLGWGYAQIIGLADASTFQNYVSNMKSMIYEQLRFTDLIIFNRVSPAVKKSFLRSNVRAYNRIAQLIFENVNGEIEPMSDEELPFDWSKKEIDLQPDDYGLWYMDAIEKPRRYKDKILSFVGMAFPTDQFEKPIVAVGRYAEVCCANDRQFMGVGVVDQDGKGIDKGEWVKVTGRVLIEYDQEENRDYISLTDSTITRIKPLPANEQLVVF